VNVPAQEIEAAHHDVIACAAVAETVGDEGRWLHLGYTSSDVVDTAFAIQLRDAADLLLGGRRPARGGEQAPPRTR
jgi:adenylosuccinate lyase